jgi:hypothetical protein
VKSGTLRNQQSTLSLDTIMSSPPVYRHLEPYKLGTLGLPLGAMVYFKGRALETAPSGAR